jgi:hypothetical protein
VVGMLYKKALFVLLILFLAMQAFAYEIPLKDVGFNGIEINSSSLKECQSISVDLTNQKGVLFEEDGILSIKAKFIGETGDNSFVSVKIDSEDEVILWPEYFSCKTDCWARVFVENLLEDAKTIRLCISTGGKTENAQIFSDSKIGLYSSPFLKVKNVAPTEILLGQRARMNILVENVGSLDTNVFVQFIAQDLRTLLEITSFDIVDGEPSAHASVPAGEEKSFTYYIKPTQASAYNLPSAILFFENVFGEEQQLLSNHPQLRVLSPDQIDLLLVGETESGNKRQFKIIIRNNWDDEFNGTLTINPRDIIDSTDLNISLKSLQEKEVLVETIDLLPGKYSLLAELDSNGIKYSSESISFQVLNRDQSFEILFAIVVVIIALAIFFRIYFGK